MNKVDKTPEDFHIGQEVTVSPRSNFNRLGGTKVFTVCKSVHPHFMKGMKEKGDYWFWSEHSNEFWICTDPYNFPANDLRPLTKLHKILYSKE